METGPLDLAAQALLVCVGILYAAGVRRLSARGRGWLLARTATFAAGLLAVWTAVGSRLAHYDDTVVTMHVVQHLLLMMAAPPLIVLGQPLLLASQAAGRRGQVRLVRFMQGPGRWLTNPAATWVVYLGSMYVMLADRPVYDYLVSHELVHDLSHGWLLAVGLAYWEPLLGMPGRLSPPARVMSLLANMPFEVLVGIWLRYQTRPLAGGGDLGGTQTAGEAFIVGATLLSTVWMVVIVGHWAAGAWREERRALARPAPSTWSTPWWVQPATEAAPSGQMQEVAESIDPPG